MPNEVSGHSMINNRPRSIIRTDFIRFRVFFSPIADYLTIRNLRRYSHSEYRGMLKLAEEAKKLVFFNSIKADEASAISDIDLYAVAGHKKFLVGLVDGQTLDCRNLKFKWHAFLKKEAIERRLSPNGSGAKDQMAVKDELKPKIVTQAASPSKFLTDDHLFNPDAPYPQDPLEYRQMMRQITDRNGIFPGDTEAPPSGYMVDPNGRGVSTVIRAKRGHVFTFQFLDPQEEHAQAVKNRMGFVFDLLSQIATHSAYGLKGASYPKDSYILRRYLTSKTVEFALFEGMPVGCSAVTSFETMLRGLPLEYIFVHLVMAINGVGGHSFQRMGLSTFAVREIVSRMYYQNLWHHEGKNLYVTPDGRIENRFWSNRVCAHSGRASVFDAFWKSFHMDVERIEPDEAAKAIVFDADRRITGDRQGRPLIFVRSNIARDVGIYSENSRYQKGPDGKPIIPESERELPTFPLWWELIGGEEEILKGASLYMIGDLRRQEITASRRKEKQREGGGPIERGGDWVRGQIVRITGG